MNASNARARAGVTLVEMLIAMVVLGLIGASMMRLMLVQLDFTNQQEAMRSARSVSQGTMGFLLSELRMVEAPGGVESATAKEVRLRVPYQFGIVCGTSGGTTTVSLLPTDSATLSNAIPSGYAWRSTSGDYVYESSLSVSSGSAAACAAESITTLAGGQMLGISPTTAAPAGTPVFFYQTLTYAFDSSTVIPGRMALLRTPQATGVPEEIAAPFDTSTAFQFYVLNASTPQASPGTLNDLRGLALLLNGASEFTPQGHTRPVTFNLSAAVFFKNRSF